MTTFTNTGRDKQQVAFAAPYAGRIVPMDLANLGHSLVCQKDSFLCAARGVSIGIAFQRKIGVGLFGGEGFIMQKLEGNGRCFVHAGGTIQSFDLACRTNSARGYGMYRGAPIQRCVRYTVCRKNQISPFRRRGSLLCHPDRSR